MSSIERRIATLEQIHSEKNILNVFIQNFAKKVQTTCVAYLDLLIEKLPDETDDEFTRRAVNEAQRLPCEGGVRVFHLWVANVGGM